MELFLNILGWFGVGLIILAYALVSWKKLKPTGKTYQLMNLVGSIAYGIYVYWLQAWAAAALQLVWAAIAIAAIAKHHKRSNTTSLEK